MKCHYYRSDEIEQYTTGCQAETVYPEDAEDWKFCPYCSDKIKLHTDPDFADAMETDK